MKLQEQVKELENCLGCVAEIQMSQLSINDLLRCSRLAVDVGSSTILLMNTSLGDHTENPNLTVQIDKARHQEGEKRNFRESSCWFISLS